ncbi:MAG: hypothetical protein IPK82_34155 [Polyangiaceae bacterium]|nr:hypothetical protein [Polyangiaceae bacterium]
MKHCLSGAALLAAAWLVGCGGKVVLGNNTSGEAGSGGEGGGGGGQTTGGSGAGNALVLEGDVVELRFTSTPITCQNPSPNPTSCGYWELAILLPDASLLVPGQIETDAVGAQVSFLESGNPQSSDPNDCPGGGGGGELPGAIEIAAVTDDHVDLNLVGFNSYFFDAKPDGSYHPPRCK